MERHEAGSSSNTKTQSSTVQWFIICSALAIIVFIAIAVFGVSLSTVLYVGALLACPLMHFWMMRGGHGRTMKDSGHKH